MMAVKIQSENEKRREKWKNYSTQFDSLCSDCLRDPVATENPGECIKEHVFEEKKLTRTKDPSWKLEK